MTSRHIDRRVFVVGVPRSGTTLVQSLLATHSALTSFTESHFFDKHFKIFSSSIDPVLIRNPTPRLHQFLTENGEEPPAAAAWFDASRRWMLRARPLLPFYTLPAARQLLRVLDELAVRRGASGWIEKTPWHLRYISFLEKVSGGEPPTYFVHVIRDGLEVVASLHEASKRWERPYDLDACVMRWNEDVGFSLRRTSAPTDRFVFYEELTSQPDAAITQVLDWLGLSWEPEILATYADVAGQLITADEDWKAGVGRRIRRSATSNRTLTKEQRSRVNRLLRHDLYDLLRERAGGISS
jgi:hypothetical protein